MQYQLTAVTAVSAVTAVHFTDRNLITETVN